MHRSTLLIFAALAASTADLQAQGLLDTIATPEKSVTVINQSLGGTWLSELRRPGPTGLQPPIPALVTFSADGSWLASPSDGTQSATHGVWIRVGDRKFLGSGCFFIFNEARALTNVTKLRINYQISADGKTLTGTTEAVVMDPAGNVLTTLGGTTFSMLRLSPEKPADFDAFQMQQ